MSTRRCPLAAAPGLCCSSLAVCACCWGPVCRLCGFAAWGRVGRAGPCDGCCLCLSARACLPAATPWPRLGCGGPHSQCAPAAGVHCAGCVGLLPGGGSAGPARVMAAVCVWPPGPVGPSPPLATLAVVVLACSSGVRRPGPFKPQAAARHSSATRARLIRRPTSSRNVPLRVRLAVLLA